MSFDVRVAQLLSTLEQMAGGELDAKMPISTAHDELDALAFGVNVLVGELRYAGESLGRAKEEADRANQAKSTLLRNVSHDLRTPLAAIVSLSELLGAGVAPERMGEISSRLRANARALLSLVDDLLDLSKVEAGQLRVEAQPTDVVAVAREVVHALEPLAQGKGVRLFVSEVAPLPRRLRSDAVRLRQILMNLLGNALKFTARGAIEVRLSVDGDGERLACDVVDSGIGLAPGQKEGLFEPFHQADGRTYGGSGLGLALSRRLAEALGGSLELAQSAPGVGSTFRLTLPLDLAGDEPVTTAPPPSQLRPLEERRLLVADDDDDIRNAVAELLELAGARVMRAPGGLETLRLASAHPQDLLLLDLRMPDLDGLEVARRLRAGGSQLRLVALTADVSDEQRRQCAEAGFDGYLSKPIEYAQLVAGVLGVLR
jgi:signal transduction histidine kinase/CheY-like chemotaxis protein